MFTEIQAWRILPLGVKQIEVSKYMIQFLQLAQYLSVDWLMLYSHYAIGASCYTIAMGPFVVND